jgi:hypothetical protein
MSDNKWFNDRYYSIWRENKPVTYRDYVKLVQDHKKIKYREAQKLIKNGNLWRKVQMNCAKFIRNNPDTKQSMLDCIKHDIMAEKNDNFLQDETKVLNKKREKYIRKINRFTRANEKIESKDHQFDDLQYMLHLNSTIDSNYLDSGEKNLKEMKREYKKLLSGTSRNIDADKLKQFGIINTDKNFKPKKEKIIKPKPKPKTIKIKIVKIKQPKKTVKIKIKQPPVKKTVSFGENERKQFEISRSEVMSKRKVKKDVKKIKNCDFEKKLIYPCKKKRGVFENHGEVLDYWRGYKKRTTIDFKKEKAKRIIKNVKKQQQKQQQKQQPRGMNIHFAGNVPSGFMDEWKMLAGM